MRHAELTADNVAALATKATYTTATATALLGLSVNEVLAIGGFFIALATYLTNVYFKRQELRQRAEFRREQLKLQAQGMPIKDE